MSPAQAKPSQPAGELRWLERYARHGGLEIDRSGSAAQAIRANFSAAAWRVVCRSPQSAFLPILRNRRLGFRDLVHYAQSLAGHGFRVAPCGRLLAAFVQSSHAFFDQAPAVPTARDDLAVMRLASLQGPITQKQLHLVQQWLYVGHKISARMSLSAVLKRASAWQARQQAQLSAAHWAFACSTVHWCGLELVPLGSALDLWDDGQLMSTCLYRLRGECESDAASRFFSVRKAGRRHATLELSWFPEPSSAHRGSYQLRDCRLFANRLPSKELVALLDRFAEHYTQLAQAQGLLPLKAKASTAWAGIAWQNPPAKRQRVPTPNSVSG